MSTRNDVPNPAGDNPSGGTHTLENNEKSERKTKDLSEAAIRIMLICVATACCIALFLALYGTMTLLGLTSPPKRFESNVVTKTVTATPTTDATQAESEDDWLATELKLRGFSKPHEVTQNHEGKGIRRIQANVGECRIELRFTPNTKKLTLSLANGDIMENPTAYKVAQEEEFTECAHAFPEFELNTEGIEPETQLDAPLPPVPTPDMGTSTTTPAPGNR